MLPWSFRRQSERTLCVHMQGSASAVLHLAFSAWVRYRFAAFMTVLGYSLHKRVWLIKHTRLQAGLQAGASLPSRLEDAIKFSVFISREADTHPWVPTWGWWFTCHLRCAFLSRGQRGTRNQRQSPQFGSVAMSSRITPRPATVRRNIYFRRYVPQDLFIIRSFTRMVMRIWLYLQPSAHS